jgi:phospholipase C
MGVNRRQFIKNVAGVASTAALTGAIEGSVVDSRANGRQAGLTYFDSQGEAYPTNHLMTFVGCSHPDPDHSYAGGRSEVDVGKMDGWLRTTTNDTFSIGY